MVCALRGLAEFVNVSCRKGKLFLHIQAVFEVDSTILTTIKTEW